MSICRVLLVLLVSWLQLTQAYGRGVLASKEAYATLLYGEKFLLGVRVLGESLRRAGTTRDLVAIVAGEISDYAEATLLKDGWIVKHVDVVHNPGKWSQAPERRFPPNFWAVYTKLLIFNLTEYSKVVYLDADVIAIKNSDRLFQCPGFCAVLRHSERLNSGVMTITPSAATLKDMLSKINTLPSYTGGDQGFLNAYFSGFVDGLLFNDTQDYSNSNYKYMRLPTKYNADVGLYVANSNRWMVPRAELHVIHFTLGPFKPWVWWTSWLIRESQAWQSLRYALPPDAAGRRHGESARQLLTQQFLWAVPPLLVALLLWRSSKEVAAIFSKESLLMYWRGGCCSQTSGFPGRTGLPAFFTLRSILVGYLSIVGALLVTLLVVPPEVYPVWGWVVTYEWAFLVLALLMGKYLHYCFLSGEASAQRSAVQHLKVQNTGPWIDTLLIFVSAMIILMMAPWMGRIMGVTSFVGNIFCTIFAAVFAVIYLTWVFVTLPLQWFMFGRAEGLSK